MILNVQVSKPAKNMVLLEIPPPDTTITLKNGLQLYFDNTFDKERYSTVMAVVKGVPDSVKVRKVVRDGDKLKPVWTVLKQELEIGDVVYMEYTTLHNAKEWSSKEWGGIWENCYMGDITDRLALIHYDYILFARRGEKIIAINDNVIVQRIKEETDEEYIEGLGYVAMDKKDDRKIVLINHDWEKELNNLKKDYTETVKKNFKSSVQRISDKEYGEDLEGQQRWVMKQKMQRNRALVIAAPEDSGLVPGDIILHEKDADVPVESSYTKTLPEDYCCMKSDHIFCKQVNGEDAPYHDKVLVRPDKAPEKIGSFFIPESSQKQPMTGTILKVGPEVKEVSPEDRVYFVIPGATVMDTGDMLVREAEVLIKL